LKIFIKVDIELMPRVLLFLRLISKGQEIVDLFGANKTSCLFLVKRGGLGRKKIFSSEFLEQKMSVEVQTGFEGGKWNPSQILSNRIL